MPLPGALLFPHALLPLYIFEPRYRAMLQHALAHERMFCVALIRPECEQWITELDFFDVATVGLVRACVGREDGTSHLILQGLQRVRFTAFERVHPFPIAQIDPLESEQTSSVEVEALGAKVLELYARLKTPGRQLPEKIDRYLSDLNDLEMLADLMTATFVSDPARRQQVLEQLDLGARLRLVIQYLRDEGGHAAA
ncbi:MAG: LON peptidase substrate-binding domain-containing protein [Verrucomicrobiota bacterium]|nr:LON peptidase substrate-binding domain-containing protein [Verrucomicrobiota bacterium]